MAPKIYLLGQLQQLRDFDLTSPTVRAKLRERYGSQLPLDEPVISPASLFASPELVTVLTDVTQSLR